MKMKGGLIVPLLTELLTHESIEIRNESDASWLYTLAMKHVERDRVRAAAYTNNEMVYSPSGLASCMRRVFLSKNHKNFGLTRVELPAPEPHFYFFTGDWLHLKWQFALYRLSLVNPDFMLLDCELPVLSKRKDHGGTIDVLCALRLNGKWELLIVDVKGLNVRSFNSVDKQDSPHEYRIQVTDYMMLLNSAITSGRFRVEQHVLDHLGMKELPKVKRAVLLAENKGGPDMNHPVALTEQIVELKPNLPEVRARLEILRAYEEAQEIPPPECTSTRLIAFTGCPFAGFCRKEVKRIEKEKARATADNSKKLKVARPTRRRRTG